MEMGVSSTVQDLIDNLMAACDGRDPKTVQVRKLVDDPNSMWGGELEYISIDSYGGSDYPLMVVVK